MYANVLWLGSREGVFEGVLHFIWRKGFVREEAEAVGMGVEELLEERGKRSLCVVG